MRSWLIYQVTTKSIKHEYDSHGDDESGDSILSLNGGGIRVTEIILTITY